MSVEETIANFNYGVREGRKLGHQEENTRLLDLLKSLGVVRDSILGDDWAVIYTETGPADICWDRLNGDRK